jgi:hypothetical protein
MGLKILEQPIIIPTPLPSPFYAHAAVSPLHDHAAITSSFLYGALYH